MMWRPVRMSPAHEQDARLRDRGLFSISDNVLTGWMVCLHTGQAVAKLGIWLEVLAVGDHGRTQVAAGKLLLLVGALCALGD